MNTESNTVSERTAAMSKRKDWGVVQRLCVEADTVTALSAALAVAFVQHNKATHFRLIQSEREGDALVLYWGEPANGNDPNKGISPLPFPLVDSIAAADFVRQWLTHAARYPADEPCTDGSTKEGFRITSGGSKPCYVPHEYGQVLCVIETAWIVYGK